MIFNLAGTDQLLLSVLYAFLLALFVTPLSIYFAQKTNLIDVPNSQPHKLHHHPVPIAGGIALFTTILLSILLLHHEFSMMTVRVMIPAAMVFGVGLWDDYRPLRPIDKAIGQVIATVAMILLGVQVHIFESLLPTEGIWWWVVFTLDIGTTLFWMVFVINAVNLIDSSDGLAIGVSNNTMIFCILLALDTQQWSIAYIAGIILGTGIVLHLFNTSPAKLFLGDSGALLIGYFLGVIAILYNPPAKEQASTWFVPILMLGIPIFDSVLVIYARWRRKAQFYNGGTDHTFHRLVRWGLSPSQAVSLINLVTVGLQIFALYLTSKEPLFANIFFFAIVIAGICVMLLLVERKPNEEDSKSAEKPI